MLALESYVHETGLEPSLLELVKMRASQINSCPYCLDMHSKDARAAGETEQRRTASGTSRRIAGVEDAVVSARRPSASRSISFLLASFIGCVFFTMKVSATASPAGHGNNSGYAVPVRAEQSAPDRHYSSGRSGRYRRGQGALHRRDKVTKWRSAVLDMPGFTFI
jgi:AhpD family alkylhydroperoxidase